MTVVIERLTIDRVDGEWPQWVYDAFAPGPKGYSSLTWVAILARLLAASAET